MSINILVQPVRRGETADLREWLSGIDRVAVSAVSSGADSLPRTQGSVLDLLTVVCASGGPAVAALKAIEIWLKARVTQVDITVGDNTYRVSSTDPSTTFKEMADVLKQIEAGAGADDGPS